MPGESGGGGRKKINEKQGPGPQEAQQKRVNSPGLQSRFAQNGRSPVRPNPSGRSARRHHTSRSQPLKPTTYPYSPSHRLQLTLCTMAAPLRPLRVPTPGSAQLDFRS